MIIEWMERYKLTMLNDDEKCQEEYSTHGQRAI